MGQSRSYPNSGALFKNTRKTEPKHPDYTGNGEMDCPHCARSFRFRLASWIKSGGNGKFLSLSFSKNDGEHPARASRAPEKDDDIEF